MKYNKMNVIPVIDLLHGRVVHAKLGDREHYLPIQSGLCAGSDPIAMVEALLQLYPFTRLYIADLDAIQALGGHHLVVADISARYPQLEIWLDAGFTSSEAIQSWQGGRIRPVLGTESLSDLSHYQQLAQCCHQRHVLSLDFKAKQYQGPRALIDSCEHWPPDVICMTLSQVGSQAGPDIAQLATLKALSNTHAIYAAGGIRNIEDLQQLTQNGIHGALIASALHTGSIGHAELSV